MTAPKDDSVRTTRLAGKRSDAEAQAKDVPYVIVIAGAAAGEAHRLTEKTVLGRDPAAGIRILEDGVSRFHARIVVEDGRAFLEDLTSTNGTFLNGEKVRDCEPLRDGDKISIGTTSVIKFTYTDDAAHDFHRASARA